MDMRNVLAYLPTKKQRLEALLLQPDLRPLAVVSYTKYPGVDTQYIYLKSKNNFQVFCYTHSQNNPDFKIVPPYELNRAYLRVGMYGLKQPDLLLPKDITLAVVEAAIINNKWSPELVNVYKLFMQKQLAFDLLYLPDDIRRHLGGLLR